MERRGRGFTLVEVLIASIVVAIVVLSILSIYTTGQDACSVGSASLSVQTTNTGSMAEMTRQIRESRIFGVAADGTWIRLQVPVDHDGDGDVLDDNRQVEWGADGRPKWYVEYAFYTEAATSLRSIWAFDERSAGRRGVDLNGDGDTNDTIEVGCIVENLKDEDGKVVSSRAITPYCVVLDLDGDGVREPLFQRLYANGTSDPDGPGPLPPDSNGSNVRIAFRSFRMADKERTILLHPNSVVATRNR